MRRGVAALLVLAALGCGQDAERVLLSQFFAASRLRDLTALRKFGTVVFEPTREGIVTSFDITSVKRLDSGEEVLISAPVRLPDGRTVRKDLSVTIDAGLVTAISERPAQGQVERSASPSPRRP